MSERTARKASPLRGDAADVGLASRLLHAAVSVYCWAVGALITLGWFAFGRVAESVVRRPYWWGWILHKWARWNLACGFFRVESEGLQQVPANAVLVSNHQSILDIAVLAAVIPPPVYFVARAEVLQVPIIGSVLRRGRHFTIRRGQPAHNEAILQAIVQRLAERGRVVFFPEGTRSRDGRVGPFKAGAFRAAQQACVALVPVALAGSRVIKRGELQLIPARIRVRFLAPRPVPAADDLTGLRDSVRDEVAAHVAELTPGTGPRI